MDSETNNVGPAGVDGVESLPARERWDQTSYAVANFLARYRDLTLRAYRQDILAFLRWCAERHPNGGPAAAPGAVPAVDGDPRAGAGHDRAR